RIITEKECGIRAQCIGDISQPAGRYAVDTFLIFLKLLVCDTHHLRQFITRQAFSEAKLIDFITNQFIKRIRAFYILNFLTHSKVSSWYIYHGISKPCANTKNRCYTADFM